MRGTVRQWTGIPTCVGIGPTKTLAKVANAVAKKNPTFGGVCGLTDPAVRAAVLRAFPVADVWGIGGATARKLAATGITTAGALAAMDARQARQIGTVVIERLVHELRGLPCLSLELVAPARKGLAVTRSFGQPMTDLADVAAAVAMYATRAGEKLRAHGSWPGSSPPSCTPTRTNRDRAISGSRATRLVPMSDDTRELLAAARRCIEAAWRGGYAYSKAGVILDDLRARADAPATLFERPPRQIGGAHGRDRRAQRPLRPACGVPGRHGHRAAVEAARRASFAALYDKA